MSTLSQVSPMSGKPDIILEGGEMIDIKTTALTEAIKEHLHIDNVRFIEIPEIPQLSEEDIMYAMNIKTKPYVPVPNISPAELIKMISTMGYNPRPMSKPINQRKFRKRRRQTGYNRR